ncbi:MAG: EamA family transporter [Alphaproteobacteria bacterium]|nr:EamA family transporter [Alphaproteobacteria bacterium]
MSAELRATLIGLVAVLLWGALALLTTWTGRVPPFQLVAMSFSLAFGLALAKWIATGERPSAHLRHPPAVWALGIGGLFGYHFFYFMALRNAPAVEASLIAYLWPLLIVLFSALLPGERLRWWHVAGGMIGLAGCWLLVTGGGRVAFQGEFALGYMAAGACAVTWSAYSVLSRRFGEVPSDVVGWFCAASAVLGLLAHLAFEATVWPADTGEWLAVMGLGLGPVGVAFFVWDHGVKRGNIRALGAASYAAPLISTLLLIAFGKAAASWVVGLACLAIVGGAVLAGRDLLWDSSGGTSR